MSLEYVNEDLDKPWKEDRKHNWERCLFSPRPLPYFWLHHVVCGILVPLLRIKPAPPALEGGTLNHWTARKVPHLYLFFFPIYLSNDCQVFQICWHIECSTLTASSFKIWNSPTGIPSPPLALFLVMLPKPTWLCIPGCLALGEWSHYHGYLGH